MSARFTGSLLTRPQAVDAAAAALLPPGAELTRIQRQTIGAVLHAQRDCIIVSATGSGKSLPCLIAAAVSNGLIVIVVPTTSLLADWVSLDVMASLKFWHRKLIARAAPPHPPLLQPIPQHNYYVAQDPRLIHHQQRGGLAQTDQFHVALVALLRIKQLC